MLLSRRILFFGGKGGVGKTTLAAATALSLAARRRRTLLVSTDPAHSTGDILQAKLGSEPRSVTAGCWAMELDPVGETDRYIADVKARLADAVTPRLAGEVERQIDIARVSPGAVEAALFERFSRILDEEGGEYDRIVFDTAPTAQTLQLLSLPEQMSAWIAGLIGRRRQVTAAGRIWRTVAGGSGLEGDEDDPVLRALEERRARFVRARSVITDPEQTAFFFVVVPERLPIWETGRAARTLGRYGIPVGGILVNRVRTARPSPDVRARGGEREMEYLAMIERDLDAWPRLQVPEREGDPVGTEALKELGDLLFNRWTESHRPMSDISSQTVEERR